MFDHDELDRMFETVGSSAKNVGKTTASMCEIGSEVTPTTLAKQNLSALQVISLQLQGVYLELVAARRERAVPADPQSGECSPRSDDPSPKKERLKLSKLQEEKRQRGN